MPRTPDYMNAPATVDADEDRFLSLEDLVGPPIEFELSDMGAGEFTHLPDDVDPKDPH